jgi:hypothetical protein
MVDVAQLHQTQAGKIGGEAGQINGLVGDVNLMAATAWFFSESHQEALRTRFGVGGTLYHSPSPL